MSQRLNRESRSNKQGNEKIRNTGKKHTESVGHHRKPNLWILGIDKGEESQVNGIGHIFKKIIEKNFP